MSPSFIIPHGVSASSAKLSLASIVLCRTQQTVGHFHDNCTNPYSVSSQLLSLLVRAFRFFVGSQLSSQASDTIHTTMSSSSSSFSSQVLVSSSSSSLKIGRPISRSVLHVKSSIGSNLSRQTNTLSGFISFDHSGSKTKTAFKVPNLSSRKRSAISALWLPSSQIAANAFTLGTAAVLPFYTFMVVAPRAQLTEKIVASCVPYVVLGLIYAYLLYLSWTPDTIKLMFASKYWLPELSGIAKMFSSEMTLASAWIHLLSVDLFAARQVYEDGLKNNIETRHSVSLCLLFCPVGILTHFVTKAIITRSSRRKERHGLN